MKITGVIYKRLRKKWGEADQELGIIYIDNRVDGRKELEMYNHEGIHILAPFLTEDVVSGIAAELTRVQWEAGFRRIKGEASQPLQDEITE